MQRRQSSRTLPPGRVERLGEKTDARAEEKMLVKEFYPLGFEERRR